MDAISFTILGEPVAKARPSHFFNKKSGIMHGYMPKKTRAGEADARAQIVAQLPKGFVPFECALQLDVRIFRARPQSLPKKVRYPTKRPDLDNYLKLIIDAMNSVVFRDDAQIVHIETSKEFATESNPPGAIVSVREEAEL